MVLAYHEIFSEEPSYLYGVSRNAFAEHLAAITANKTLSAPEDKECRITFDDGHRSQYEYAFPLLERAGLRGTFFVTAGWTDRHTEYMTAPQLRELSQAGHQVQGHGWSHKMLTLCSAASLYDELRCSKQQLEDQLGCAVNSISIPHGRWNANVLRACLKAGYRDVYVSDPNLVGIDRAGIRLIGRLMVTRNTTAHAVIRVLKRGRLTTFGARSAKSVVKRAARSVLGEQRYHRLWRSVAAQTRAPIETAGVRRPVRILHLISSSGFYGAEAVVLNLARSMEGDDCHSTVAVLRNARNPHTEIAERAAEAGLRTEVISCGGRVDPTAIKRIRQVAFDSGIDIVHTHGFKSDIYATVAARKLGVRLVSTHHSDWPERSLRLYGYHLLDRAVLKNFDKIVAVSHEIRTSLVRSGMDREKVETIQNGCALEPFLRVAATHIDAFPELGSSIRIGLVGRLIPGKGQRTLLSAATGILKRHPNAVFVLVGDGPDRETLVRMVAGLDLKQKVFFAGTRTDMPDVYASLDIVVLPSATEGLPITLVEALAARRPVIATRVGGVPQVVRHRETGLLIEPGDVEALRAAILEMMSSPELRQALPEQGQKLVSQRFSASVMAQSYLECYRRVLS